MTYRSPKANTPYQFHNGNNHNIECGRCGEKLKSGDIVLIKSAPYKHIGNLKDGKHLIHAKHMVDAHGEPLYEE